MRNSFPRLLTIALLSGSLLAGCKKWDDHNALKDPLTGKDLFVQIKEQPDLSKFAELLTKSGYDKVIASSQNYTVFAPVNAALATLDPAIVNDSAKLRLFVGNHITNQLRLLSADSSTRLAMVNGKYNNLAGFKLDDANVTNANTYAKNGFLHIINKAVPARASIWEFLQNDPLMPTLQKSFILSQKDTSGRYTYLSNVADINNEAKQFTYFVIANAGWTSEVVKYSPFFFTNTADSTVGYASVAIARDLGVEAVYDPATIPDTILTKFSTKVGVDKSAIVQTVKLSNGIVYIMNKLPVLPKDKFKQWVIQGENYSYLRNVERRAVTYIREKRNPNNGQEFRDVLVFNHDIAQFYIAYQLGIMPTCKYRAYWVAVHDNINNNTGTFRQMLGIGDATSPALPYITVSPMNYNEVYLGEFTLSYFKPNLTIFLTADNSTNDDANKITVDYIRLEPVL